MYGIGDQVLYGIHGVCRVVDIADRMVDRLQRQYYVLEPIEQPNARFYIPTGNQAAVSKLRKILSEAELFDLLRSPQARQDCWIADENQRKQRYRELINSGDRAALLSMVGTLHRHKQVQQAAGRKFHLCDDNFLHDAEKLLCAEVSVVLHMPAEQVPAFLKEQMQVQ